jgi:hypothetical protein
MPGEWWAESLELTTRAIMRSFPARRHGLRFRSSRWRLMNQQANNAKNPDSALSLKRPRRSQSAKVSAFMDSV